MRKNKKSPMIENALQFIELLKEGKVFCRDFTEDRLKALLAVDGVDPEEFPQFLKKDLMLRKLIPADFRALDAEGQLELLLRKDWFGSDPEVAAQLAWEKFSPDELVLLMTFHPGLQRYCPEDVWTKTAGADKKAWFECLRKHHRFAGYCPEEFWKNLSSGEVFRLALAQPGLAAKMDLSVLSSDNRDALLRKHPELAGWFDLEKVALLFFCGNRDSCDEEECGQIGRFLEKMLGIPAKEASGMAAEGDALLGVYSHVRAQLLKMQINKFLDDNCISDLTAEIMPFERLLKPENNLEVQILKKNVFGIVTACMEGEQLVNPAVMLNSEYFMFNQCYAVCCLLLMKAVDDLEKMDRELLRFACEFGCSYLPASLRIKRDLKLLKNPEMRSKYEQLLLDAVEDKQWQIVSSLAGSVQLNALTVEEALDCARKLPEKLKQQFFDSSLSPMLRAYLLAELTVDDSSEEKIALVNVLLDPFWHTPGGDWIGQN